MRNSSYFTASFLAIGMLCLSSCGETKTAPNPSENTETSFKANTIAHIEVWDDALSQNLLSNAKIEQLADGFSWSEGPAWDNQRQQLYFSDVPQNKAFSWSERDGLQTFLDPSGIYSRLATGFREPGSNGLLMTPDGRLIIANHGKRALEYLNLDTRERSQIIGKYKGLPFNSPNDVAQAHNGDLFFTDPPYGLEGLDKSALKEQSFNGVYHLSKNGNLSVIDDSLSFPNGIALSPDEQYLYVSVSDPLNPVIMRYKKRPDGQFKEGQIWFDATTYHAQGLAGLPDGMTVADNGNVFTSGPGGIFILDQEGKALGQIRFKDAVANCTFGDDGRSLYITAGAYLVRVKLVSGKAL